MGLIESLPAHDKPGWPWSYEVDPQIYRSASIWPKITIVTPSYNQGDYIEETIRSILLQNYPNLEYIVIDGGSCDGTIEILSKYSPWITYWHSQTDDGQSDAIVQGFRRGSGDIMAWLNSDDVYSLQALFYMGNVYQKGMHWWCGYASDRESDSKIEHRSVNFRKLVYLRQIIPQVSTFWTREIWDKAGSKLASYHLAMDFELWVRFSMITSCQIVKKQIGFYRGHESAKTGTWEGKANYRLECDSIREEHLQRNTITNFMINLMYRWELFVNSGNPRHLIGRRKIPALKDDRN